jgi:hypothetical protein
MPRRSQDTPPREEIWTAADAEAGEAEARRHYDELAAVLEFPGRKPPAKLDQLLSFLGYRGLTAARLEHLSPETLMSPDNLALELFANGANATGSFKTAPGDVLVVRYFSPSATDVSRRLPASGYGWRRLVRLRPLPGSPAAARGLAAVHLLLSWSAIDLTRSPFDGAAAEVQAMLTAAPDAGWPWPAGWLVFGPPSEGSPLRTSIESTWDAADPALPEAPQRRYYPPVSCMHCHGGDTYNARLQPLDSDHWEDRVAANDDFPEIGRSPWSVLFDAGQDPDAVPRGQVFEVLRTLNGEIAEQNRLADEFSEEAGHRPQLFPTWAADNWLRLHSDSARHIAAPERGLSADDREGWSAGNPAEADLTRLLNRYCYRCHSAVSYHVFDKQSVLTNRELMLEFLDADGYDSMQMPQDRVLEDDARRALRTALQSVGGG